MAPVREIFMADSEPVQWITWFNQEPVKALRDAFTGCYYFGSLNPVSRATLLTDWLEAGVDEFTPEAVDAALARLIEAELVGIPEEDGWAINNSLWRDITELIFFQRRRFPMSLAALAEKKRALLAAKWCHPVLMNLINRLFPPC